jgi:hypothetical protein
VPTASAPRGSFVGCSRSRNADGSFSNPRFSPAGIVFDTGQVLFGLVRGHQASGDPALLAAARRAAGWLTAVADERLRWRRYEHLGTPHVYNSRTAWALLLLNELDPDPRREAVARSNLDWAVSEQQPSGFFDHCAWRTASHTVAYTARGLLESGLMLGERRYVDSPVDAPMPPCASSATVAACRRGWQSTASRRRGRAA